MSTTPDGAREGAPVSHRPLPARPNLEYEHKQAKKLLRALHDGDTDALARFRAQRSDDARAPEELQLADAQFTIAREYGFLSWPKLVLYFEMLHRHTHTRGNRRGYAVDVHERQAQAVLVYHRERRAPIGDFLATFIPRFFGRTANEVYDSPITIEDARLLIARQSFAPSWEVLLERAKEKRPDEDLWEFYESPKLRASEALRRGDMPALKSIVAAHPELLQTSIPAGLDQRGLLLDALLYEWDKQTPEARASTDWLVAQGADLKSTASYMLTSSFMGMGLARGRVLESLRFLVARGADPNWVAPNGLSVLEHALFLGRDPAVSDFIAERATIRRAFWIYAGLGDVPMVRSFFASDGELLDEARRDRPDFNGFAIGGVRPFLPDAPDVDIIWEAAWVAATNKRFDVLEEFFRRGLPVDHAPWNAPMLQMAVQLRLADLVEFLVSSGADPLKSWGAPHEHALMLAEWTVASHPDEPDARRMFLACGGTDIDAVVKKHNPPRTGPVGLAPRVKEMIEFAKVDAKRMGRSQVDPDSLFVGLLADPRAVPLGTLRAGGVDSSKLRRMIEDRIVPRREGELANDLSLSPECAGVIDAAREHAMSTREGAVMPQSLLAVLCRDENGAVADIIRKAGGDVAAIRTQAEKI